MSLLEELAALEQAAVDEADQLRLDLIAKHQDPVRVMMVLGHATAHHMALCRHDDGAPNIAFFNEAMSKMATLYEAYCSAFIDAALQRPTGGMH